MEARGLRMDLSSWTATGFLDSYWAGQFVSNSDFVSNVVRVESTCLFAKLRLISAPFDAVMVEHVIQLRN